MPVGLLLAVGLLVGCSAEEAPSATPQPASPVGDAQTDSRRPQQLLCVAAIEQVNTVVADADRAFFEGAIDDAAWRRAMTQAQEAAEQLLSEAGSDAAVVSAYVEGLRERVEEPPTEPSLTPWYDTAAPEFAALCESVGTPLGVIRREGG